MSHSRGPITAAEWPVAVEAAVLLLCAAAAVRLLPLRRAVDVITAWPRLGPRVSVPPPRLAGLVSAVGRRIHCRCLPQALVTRRLLAHQGVASDVIIGTARSARGLRAHAWVQVDGRPVGEGDVSSYKPIYTVDADRRSQEQAA